MSETIADLRSALFSTLRGLSDKEEPMEIDRARAIAEVAQTIINSAKVEVDHMRVAGGSGSGFIPDANVPQLANVETTETPAATKIVTRLPGATITQHKMRG